MPVNEEYRANLAICWRRAETAPNEQEKSAWLDMAETWRLLVISEEVSRSANWDNPFDPFSDIEKSPPVTRKNSPALSLPPAGHLILALLKISLSGRLGARVASFLDRTKRHTTLVRNRPLQSRTELS
jgi:hypothetical protein